jgi:hypothetical protein
MEGKYFLHAGVAAIGEGVELGAVRVVVDASYNHSLEGHTVW